MFQKLTLYRIAAGLPDTADTLGQYLMRSEFAPTAANQPKSSGFVPPREPHGAFAEAVAGHWIARVMIESRKVPGDVLQKRVDELAHEFEQLNGRRPGRKMRVELKEHATEELLPQAFPKRVAVPVWIDKAAGLLAIGSTSQAQIDEVITLLVRAVPDFAVALISTAVSPVMAMAAVLERGHEWGHFVVGRDCVLEATDESKAVVKYQRQELDRDDVREHLRSGKMPKSLAFTWRGRVSFTLTEDMQLKRITLLDLATDQIVAGTPLDDLFDGDVAIITGELKELIADLIAALGGEEKAQA